MKCQSVHHNHTVSFVFSIDDSVPVYVQLRHTISMSGSTSLPLDPADKVRSVALLVVVEAMQEAIADRNVLRAPSLTGATSQPKRTIGSFFPRMIATVFFVGCFGLLESFR